MMDESFDPPAQPDYTQVSRTSAAAALAAQNFALIELAFARVC